MTVNGIDVANYQVANYSTKGLDFVFVKATEGTSYVNPKHAAQVTTARSAGLVVGHYHFVRPGSMSAQAAYFLQHAAPKAGDMLCLDWEDTGVSGAQKDAFLRAVQAARPANRLVLYANLDFWKNRDSTSFCADGLFIADPSAPKGHPRVEHPWLFHQHSISGGTDQDAGNFADRAALRRWAAGTTTTNHLEDDVQLTDIVKLDDWVKKAWSADKGLQDNIEVNTAIGSGYAHARRADETGLQVLAQVRQNGSALTALTQRVDRLEAAGTAPEIDYAKLAAALIAAATKGA